MSYPVRLALTLFAALGAACTIVPEEPRIADCQATDWWELGLNDGRLGVPRSARNSSFAHCQALGYPPDYAAYDAGRAEGLKLYCTAENGYDAGYQGRPYRGVCPPELEAAFLEGYAQGKRDRLAAAAPVDDWIIVEPDIDDDDHDRKRGRRHRDKDHGRDRDGDRDGDHRHDRNGGRHRDHDGRGHGGWDRDRDNGNHDRGDRDHDRGDRDHDRGDRDHDRGGGDHDRGDRDYDRGGRDHGWGSRDHDWGGGRGDDDDHDRGGGRDDDDDHDSGGGRDHDRGDSDSDWRHRD